MDPILIPQPIGENVEGLSLDVMARLVLSAVDGKTTISQINELCGIDGDLTQKILWNLLSRGLVTLPGLNQEHGPENKAPSGPKSDLEIAIDEMYGKLESTHFYELFGIAPNAPKPEIRKRYFELSKRFHPDKAFGENAKSLRNKMDVIFRKLTEAYDTLSRAKSREEYDASISQELELYSLEQNLKSAIDSKSSADIHRKEPASGTEKEPEEEQKSHTAKPKLPKNTIPPARRSVSGAPQNIKRYSQPGWPSARRATSSTPSPAAHRISENAPSAAEKTSVPPRPSNPAHDKRREKWRKERAGRAMAAILNRSSVAPTSLSSVHDSLRDAEIAIEHDRHGDALRLLSQVLSVDPENERAQTLVGVAQEGHAQKLAQSTLRKGRLAMRKNDLREAEKNFRQVLESDPSHVDAKHLLAESLIQQKKDFTKALSLMREVIATNDNRARYYATFGDLILMEGDTNRAREAYSRALELEPDNKEIKKKLKACRK